MRQLPLRATWPDHEIRATLTRNMGNSPDGPRKPHWSAIQQGHNLVTSRNPTIEFVATTSIEPRH
ncbi:hypothetical protein P168DRAFT_190111 [Aspergillus campestris IBT 28561]|uniref:Uncharacterized protein n=1 Tax=Aspergillus campestris (strain IBT 28561) TaxID=1392248 RepID=A0A2I1CYJ9_ASPC2|nr:uncharacterized protein P168DRAFT_190111 [Aspergillus campestris IBT 28561]PKY02698.1 hypothetical protein P168DRAFT_190111 [Aspergillus campestris IBT 28561]